MNIGRRLGPLTPIFDPAKETGSIVVGSTPGSAPTLPDDPVGEITTSGQNIAWIAKSGSTVIATTDNFTGPFVGHVFSIDVSDPTNPTVQDSADNDWGANSPPFPRQLSRPEGVVADGNYGYIASYNGDDLIVVDITDPTDISFPAGATHATDASQPLDVAKHGTHVSLCTAIDNSIFVVNVANPLAPSTVAGLVDATQLDENNGIAADANYLYVAAGGFGDRGLTIVDVSTPASPTIASRVTDATLMPERHNRPVVDGDYVYMVSGANDSLVVIDVTNRASPAGIVGSIVGGALASPVSVAKSGNRLFVPSSDPPAKIYVIDVSDPTDPTIIDTIDPPSPFQAGRCIVDGDYLYTVNNGIPGISIFDISI